MMLGLIVGFVNTILVHNLFTKKYLEEQKNPMKYLLVSLAITSPLNFLVLIFIEIVKRL